MTHSLVSQMVRPYRRIPVNPVILSGVSNADSGRYFAPGLAYVLILDGFAPIRSGVLASRMSEQMDDIGDMLGGEVQGRSADSASVGSFDQEALNRGIRDFSHDVYLSF